MKDNLSAGQVVLDKAIAEDAYIVVDADAGTISDQDAGTQKAIFESRWNSRYDLTAETECVDCIRVGVEMSDTVYTFPRERLWAPSPNAVTCGYPPNIWSKAQMLIQLFETLQVSDIAAMRAGIDGRVILCALELLKQQGRDVDSFDGPDVYHDIIIDCPDCGSSVRMSEPIEPIGGGDYATATIDCLNEGCEWSAREEWVHRVTIEHADELPYTKARP